jgi:hypothetical protein
MTRLSTQQKMLQLQRNEEILHNMQEKDLDNRRFEIFLKGPNYVQLADALLNNEDCLFRGKAHESEIKRHLHLFAKMIDRLIAERES